MEPKTWQFPELEIGDDILVSRDPTQSDRLYAKVTQIKSGTNGPEAVDAMACKDNRIFMMLHLWHKDDPRVKAFPERFQNVCSGIFDVTPSTQNRYALLRRMETLEKRFADLEHWLARQSLPDSPGSRNTAKQRKTAEPAGA